MSKPLRIFVLSDTHDRLPPKLKELAAGVDEIWHLGDVCAYRHFTALRQVGPPVVVVHGNCDSEKSWPLIVHLERNGVRFRLVHIAPPFPPAEVDVLLHGHTHVPRDETLGGLRFLNPGCVTRPNRGAPPSVAHLEIGSDGSLKWELTRLS